MVVTLAAYSFVPAPTLQTNQLSMGPARRYSATKYGTYSCWYRPGATCQSSPRGRLNTGPPLSIVPRHSGLQWSLCCAPYSRCSSFLSSTIADLSRVRVQLAAISGYVRKEGGVGCRSEIKNRMCQKTGTRKTSLTSFVGRERSC